MMTNGPTGGSLADLKATNTMIVSTDQVAADAFGATLLGRQAGARRTSRRPRRRVRAPPNVNS